MNALRLRQRSLLWIVCAWIFLCSATAWGQKIDARISTREAWVGSPVVLQLRIRNAQNYSLPEDFEIDGCDVRSAGTPSQSSQIMIINGRRSESRSVTMQYQITPRRPGEFQIPALAVEIDGVTEKTRPISFVAAQSETGDLLFVEVEGAEESVFVGQPLDIKLKIWLKPYTDHKSSIKLDEGQMWQLLSNQTSWGSFEDRMQELAENRQRPGGDSVLRKNQEGRAREYYLYEINGTIYPTKPGKIDASDLQVVVNYPLSLGRRRDPMESLFGDSPFSGSSLMKQMMGDGLFSSSFGRRLTVTESRPVAAEANVNSTVVLPVPVAGQPADYRGAVGRYKIITQADPKNVAAGDPVTLRLGIIGDGPMELVQAPPLHEIESLVSDFRVTDQSLAGFVKDDTKVFMTTIRPRSEEVVRIPPIPFSFFDPEEKEYQTVYSEPIELEVEKAESLALDAVVSNTPSGAPAESEANDTASGAPSANGDWRAKLTGMLQGLKRWWYVALVPPVCLLAFFVTKFAPTAPAVVARFRSPMAIAKQGIQQAETESDLADVLRQYVAGVTRKECPNFERAVGRIRETRDDQLARKMESLYQRIGRSTESASRWMATEQTHTLEDLKIECRALLLPVEQVWKNRRRRA